VAVAVIRFLKRFFASLRYYVKGIVDYTNNVPLFLFGGGLAFATFVCVVPLVLIIFSILGNILDSPAIEAQIYTVIEGAIPYTEYAERVKDFISSRVEEFIEHRDVARYTGIAGLLFAASGVFGSMRTILDKVYDVKQQDSIVHSKIKDIVLVLSIVFFTSIAVVVFPTLEIMEESSDEVSLFQFLRFSFLEEVALSAAAFVIVGLLFFVLYYFIPSVKIELKTAVVSAVSATLFWELATQLFGYYISNFATLGRIYGTYIFLIVVAFWIYYSSLVFILGAEIGWLSRNRYRA
jgi:membrane protein